MEAIPLVEVPAPPSNNRYAWAPYSFLAGDLAVCDHIRKQLASAGVPTVVYSPKQLHRQEAFASLGYRPGDLPVSEVSTHS